MYTCDVRLCNITTCKAESLHNQESKPLLQPLRDTGIFTHLNSAHLNNSKSMANLWLDNIIYAFTLKFHDFKGFVATLEFSKQRQC